MLSILKAEYKKFLTVRSTYVVTIFVLLLALFLSTFVFGYHQAVQKATSPIFIADTVLTMTGLFVTFLAILAILLVAHEYRYNTILYSFTLSRSRLAILIAKVIVMLSYATIVGAVVIVIAYFGSQIGLSFRNLSLSPQEINFGSLIWQSLVYVWGYALVGIVLAVLIRSIVGSIVAFFVLPTIEGILSPILKQNAQYLPFRSLDSIPAPGSPDSIAASAPSLDNVAALGVFAVYLAVFGTVAVVLFLKRDATA